MAKCLQGIYVRVDLNSCLPNPSAILPLTSSLWFPCSPDRCICLLPPTLYLVREHFRPGSLSP